MGSDSFGGALGSGPLHRGHRSGPPILAEYPDFPEYDLTTVVQMLGVRPITLWSWQQQLGMLPPDQSGEAVARRYSERDLVACLWVRDQLLKGISVGDAADLLWRAQPAHDASPGQDTSGGARDAHPRPASAPVPGEHVALAGPPDQPYRAEFERDVTSGVALQQPSSPQLPSLASLPSMPSGMPGSQPPAVSQPPLWSGAQQPGVSGPPRPIPTPLRPLTSSGPLRPANPSGPLRAPMPSGPLRAAGSSGPLRAPNYTVPLNPAQGTGMTPYPGVAAGPLSGPLRGGPSRVLQSSALPTPSGSRWPIPTAPSGRELRGMVPLLVRAFATFDTYTANRLVNEAISTRSFEIACLGLLLPAVNRVADLGAHRQMSNPEQRFALNFVRGRLFAVFDAATERLDAPIVFVACAPREMEDVGALMLATFWRRVGLRVVFLGQDTDEHDLVREAYARRPQLICVCVNTPQRVRALTRIAKGIMHLDGSATVFTYSGAPFSRNPELQRRVPGVYLGDDPASATWHALRLLGIDLRNGPPPAMPGAAGAEFAG